MFLGTFSDNFESFEVFAFFKVFSKPRPSKVHWRLFFETKLPQNRFRTCLDNIRDSFGHFRNIESFHFFQSFPYSTLQGAMCKIFTEKITSKHVQNMFDCFWERFLGILKKWKFFSFLKLFHVSTLKGALGLSFPKNLPQNKLKTSLDNFRNIFGHFWNSKTFSIFFSNFFQVSISRVPWARKEWAKKQLKSSLDISGNVFRDFESLKVYPFFEIFRILDPPGCTGRNFLPEKTPRSMLKTCLNTFGNVFGHFEKMKVFQFFEVFPRLDLPGCTGQFFLRRLPQNKFETCLDTFKNVLDTFEKSNFFRFFFEFLQNSISRLHWARKFRKKIPQISLDTFGKVFRDFGTLKSFRFSWIFLSLLCALGTAFSVEKLNQNILKQCFWEHFRTILKVSKFLLFLKFFPSLDPPRCTGDFFSKQNYLKTGSEHVWTILGTVLDTLEIMKFSIFSNLSLTRPSRVQCAKFLPKKLPRNMFKTCLIAFGNVFWAFWKNESFPVFWSYSTCRPSRVHWAFLFQKTYLKTSWKLVWTILGTFLDTFEIPKLFRFFFEFFPSFDLQGALGKKRMGEKITSKINLDTFGNVFRDFENLNFFPFFEIFRFLDPPGCTGRSFLPEKTPRSMLKTCLNTFGNVFGHFEKMKVFQFFEVFPSLDLPGCTGQFFLRRLPQNKFETCLDTFKNVLDTFEKSNFFSIFLRIFTKFDLQVALGKKISEEITSSKFGHFWKGFLGFWNFESFSIFVDFFLVSCVHWAQRFPSKDSIKTFSNNVFGNIFGQFWKFRSFCFFKVFSKPRPSKVHWRLFFETKLPQNRFRTCLDNIRDSFGHFRNIESFHFFQSFPYSTLQGAMCKIFTEKITSKHVQNMFDCFWERFLGILKKWKFSSFLKLFHVSTLKGALGLSFPKNLPQNKLKTSLDNFRNIFGHFWNSKTFSIFFSNFFQISISRVPWARKEWAKKQLKSSLDISGNVFRDFESLKVYPFFEIFRILDPPGCTGRNFLPEKTPRSMLKTCLNTFGNVFGHFEKMKVFQFFEVFPRLDLPGCTGQFFLRRLPQNKFETCLDTFKNVLDTFEKSNFFRFFFEFLQNSISRLHWARKFRKKIPQASLDTFGKVFRDFGTLKSFRFSWIFLSLLCALGTAFSVEKLNQNILKQCFWEHFRTILKVSKFLLFLKFFPSLDPPRCTGDFFSKQNYLKTGSEHVWTILGTVLDTLEILKFSIFSNLSLTRPSRVQCAKFLPKKLPRNMFKTCLIAFGNVFWAFWKNESFPVFWSYSTCRPSRVHWAFLFQKTYLKTSWKLVWTILGTFLDTFEIPKLFRFFFEFFPSFDLQGALGKKRMGEKITSKINLDTFGNVFRDFENLNFFPFFEIFRFLDPPGCTGRSFLPEKTPRSMLKTCLNTFGNVFGHFEKMKVFQFFEVFPSLDLPGCTGQFFLRRLPQNKFETCLDTFKNVLDTFEKSNFFSIFLRIFTKFDLQVALGKKISEEITSSKFGHFWKGFWGFWNFEIFSIFVDFFWVSCVHWKQRFPSKNSIKTFSNNVFGNIFGQFWKFGSFSFF